MKSGLILHPLFFAVLPSLFLYSHNIGIVSINEILLPTGFILLLMVLALTAAYLILRNKRKSALIVSIFLIISLSYRHLYLNLGFTDIRAYRLFFLFGVFLLIALSFFSLYTRRDLGGITQFLNIFSLCMVGFCLINIGTYTLKNRGVQNSIESAEKMEENSGLSEIYGTENHPDIYYIILDRYSSGKTLQEVYGFDNEEFLKYLSDRGFFVASESVSNYSRTDLSLASSLNMDFINYLADKMGRESTNRKPIYELLQNHKVGRFLKSRGYKTVHFGSGWDPTSWNVYADLNINLQSMSEFSMALYTTSMLHPIGKRLGIMDKWKKHWERELYNLERLAEIPSMKEATFAFAHVLIPHEPYVFDKDGKYLGNGPKDAEDRRERYIGQVKFINRKIRELVEVILSRSEKLPVILIQADEGEYPSRFWESRYSFSWKNATEPDIREKMGILNAYYMPNGNVGKLYPSITPVNAFRVIFNEVFQTNFDLLEDESYVSLEMNHPYHLIDVTETLGANR